MLKDLNTNLTKSNVTFLEKPRNLTIRHSNISYYIKYSNYISHTYLILMNCCFIKKLSKIYTRLSYIIFKNFLHN